MEITKQQTKVLKLSAKIDPRSLAFKLPGIQTWFLLILFFALCIFLPWTALTISRILAIYLLVRLVVVVAIFYGISLIKIRQTHQRMRMTAPLDGLTDVQIARYPKIQHVVVIPNFNEPVEILSRTLQALADQTISGQQLTVVLAMEDSEVDACLKGKILEDRFAQNFAHFFVTFHPARQPQEIPGKAANQNWGARYAKHELVDKLGLRLENMTITSCDADSELDPDYFRELTREFITCPKPDNAIWQTPIFFDHNIWQTPASVRLLTFISNAVLVSELSTPFCQTFPLSTYSFSFKLLADVGYWDPIVISEDWHMFLRCFFAKDGDMTVRSMFLPTIAEPFLDETTLKTWKLVFWTRVRHAWGAGDMVYMLQQWNRQPRTPVFKKLGRFLKIWHDNMAFILGSVFVTVGTLLSIILEHNPVITHPPFPIPYVMDVLNGLGMVGMLTIWIVERIRCNDARYSWKLSTIGPEIASWIIFPAITFFLAGLPVLHAHTKILLGSDLSFARTPKGIMLKK